MEVRVAEDVTPGQCSRLVPALDVRLRVVLAGVRSFRGKPKGAGSVPGPQVRGRLDGRIPVNSC